MPPSIQRRGAMTVPDFSKELFAADQTGLRLLGYISSPTAVRSDTETAVTVVDELLDRANQQPSNKWLALQMRPEDALKLAISVLGLAKDAGWKIPQNALDLVEQVSMGAKGKH
jgi:hypothetical protein